MKKKKIIFFHQSFDYGGVENSILFLANSFYSKSYDICIASNFKSKKKVHNVPYEVKDFKYKKLYFNFFLILKFIYDQKKINKNLIIISNQFNANILFLFIRLILKFKLVIYERNHPIEIFKLNNFIKKKLYLFLIRVLYKNADLRIGISKKLSKSYSIISNSPFTTVYNSFSYNQLIQKSKESIGSDIKKVKYNFLYISRFTNRKDPILALHIISELLKYKINSDDIHLTMVGDGPLKLKVKNEINRLNLKKNISILNPPNNHLPIYKKCNFFLHCSHYEGFCNVLVEAILFKLFAISFNCLSGPSEILSNGKGGLLYSTRDPKKIAKIIYFNLRNIKKQKIQYAYKSLSRFDHIKILPKLEILLTQLND